MRVGDESFLEVLLTQQRRRRVRGGVEEPGNTEVSPRDPEWFTPAATPPVPFRSLPAPQPPIPLWPCIFSCSSAQDHFDVYFTATAKSRRGVSRGGKVERGCVWRSRASPFALLLFH